MKLPFRKEKIGSRSQKYFAKIEKKRRKALEKDKDKKLMKAREEGEAIEEKEEKEGKDGREKETKEKPKGRINKVAWKLSQKFPYTKLAAAESGEGGLEVFGYLEIHNPDYQYLLDNYVLDRACYYAKARFEAVIIKKYSFIDLLRLPRSVIELTKEIELENYPSIPFKRIIISHPEKTYESSIEWIENYPYTVEGFDTHVNFGPANYDLLGFALWNRPWFLLVHAPGEDKFIYKATAKAKDISRKIVSIPEKIIHKLRGEGDLLKKEIDELKRDKTAWKEKASDLEQELMNRSLSPITGLPGGSEFKLSTMPKDVLLAIVVGIIAIIIVGIIVGGIA